MKTFVSLLLMSFAVLLGQAQTQLKLSIKKGSDAPNYETEHLYLLEVSNPGSKTLNFNVALNNKECNNIKKIEQTEFNREILDQNKQSKKQMMTVQPGKSLEFYVKLSRPNNAKLNTWNCTEVVAMSNEGSAISNAITIESLIPNPNNNN